MNPFKNIKEWIRFLMRVLKFLMWQEHHIKRGNCNPTSSKLCAKIQCDTDITLTWNYKDEQTILPNLSC